MDGWEDDDDVFDDIHHDTAIDTTTEVIAADARIPSSLQSFTQHHELNLSAAMMTMASPLAKEGAFSVGAAPLEHHVDLESRVKIESQEDSVGNDGWSDDGVMEEEIAMEEAHHGEAPSVTHSDQASSDAMSNDERSDVPTPAATEGILSRAAGAFGAALLASVDQDDGYKLSRHGDNDEEEEEEDESQQSHEGQKETSFRFGGGFVMKGLRGFIEAATTPQKNDESNSMEEDGDGWDDDEEFDLEEEEEEDGWSQGKQMEEEVETKQIVKEILPSIEREASEEPEFQDEPLVHDESGAWDDFDVEDSFNDEKARDDLHQSDIAMPESAIMDRDAEISDIRNNEVSDSIKDFVAKTESTLNSAFEDASKTPTRTPRDEFLSKDDDRVDEIESTDLDDAAVSKSLTEFVDTLHAELNELKVGFEESDAGGKNTAVQSTPVSDEVVYNFDESKDNSPEPVEMGSKQFNMPHQDSWYLNAMEGGKGGLVYSNQNHQSTVEEHQDSIMHINSDFNINSAATSERGPFGMPLSEMPSVENSENGSNADLSSTNGCNFQQSELQCKCLELILPLPDSDKGSPVTESGFGTKTLPDGTTVLVNYEKLLQNEATKRILLQRSLETYERTMEKMQSKYHAVLKTSHENEEARQFLDSQLDMAQHENLNLQALVAKLEKEIESMKNETPSSESHLFQEELSAAAGERTRLEKQVEALNEQLRSAHQQHAIDFESHESLSRRLEDMKIEQSRLEELVHAVQSDLSEAQQTCSLLKSENDALQQELDAKNIEIATNESEEHPDESAAWKTRIYSLEKELREKTSDCVALNDQVSDLLSEQAINASKNEQLIQDNTLLSSEVSMMRGLLATLENENVSLRSIQTDSEARIVELTAIIESTDKTTDEIDRLAAENASLSHKLRLKSTENEENVASLTCMQTELDATKARLLEFEQTMSDRDASHEIDKSLREENEVLKAEMANLQSDFALLKQCKLELESTLEERTKCIEKLHVQVENLQTQASQAVCLQGELADLRETLDEKECFIEKLNAQLLDAQNSHAAIVSENQQQLALSHGEVSTLQSQINEVQRHHNDTMAYIEQQLANLLTKNSELTTQCDEYRDKLERVQRETFEANRSNSEMETKYAEQVFKLEGENLELSAALKIAQDALSSMKYTETKGAKLRVRELEEDAEVLHENIQSLVSTIEELQQAKEELIHENSKLVRALEDTASTDEQGEVRVVQESRELRTMLDHYQKAFSNAEQTISDLKVQLEALQGLKDGDRKEYQLLDDLSEKYRETKMALERTQMEKGNLLARNGALEQDNKSLEFQLTETSLKSNQVLARNRELEQDNKSLEFQLKEASSKSDKLEANIASLEAQMKEQEKDALDAIAQWETRCSSLERNKNGQISHLEHASLLKEKDRLEQQTILLSEQVHELTTQLNSIQSSQSLSSAEREKLLARILELEEELRDENVNELRDELTSLQEERQQLDLDNEELLVQLGLMQQSKLEHEGELQNELTRLRGQVATLQDSIVVLQRELDEARSTHISNDHARISEVVERLHKENIDLQNNIARLGSEKSSLEDDINDLTETVKALEHQQQQQGNQTCDNTEVLQLKARVHDLELKLADKEQKAVSTKKNMRQALDLDNAEIKQLKSEMHDLELKLADKEREMTSTHHAMNQALKQKDDDILKLTTEGFLRETTLKDMTRHVEAKNAVDSIELNFGDDMREAPGLNDEEKDHHDNDSLQDLLADDIDSDDYLRHQIVILAQALERSELQRADALDRITKERKSNADSLRQLGESVKRFYSALRCSDAV